MSIYDDSFSEDPKKTPAKAGPVQPASQRPGKPPVDVDDGQDSDSPRRRRGCGCGSCLLAFIAIGLICTVICGIGGYLALKRAPDWAHDAIVAAVNDSELDDKAKEEITAQMDRLLQEYKADNVSNEHLAASFEELVESPVLVLILVYAAMESYVEPSGLSDEEKVAANLAFQRVARGVFEEEIDPDDLEEALDYVSKEDFSGNRQVKSQVSDEELRALVKECNRVADKAEIPNEPYQVDIVAEVTRIVDRALGIIPVETPEPDDVDPLPPDETAAASEPVDSSPDDASTDGTAGD